MNRLAEGLRPLHGFWRALVAGCRRRPRLVVAVVVFGCVFSVFTDRLFLRPVSDAPPRVDAMVVLSGGHGERIATAERLLANGVADVLVISLGERIYPDDTNSLTRMCADGRDDVELICVHASPDTTFGEAQFISDLLEQRQLTSVLVVTTDHHVERARRWFRRCFDGDTFLVGAPASTGPRDVLHEWAGVFDQLVIHRSCGPEDPEPPAETGQI